MVIDRCLLFTYNNNHVIELALRHVKVRRVKKERTQNDSREHGKSAKERGAPPDVRQCKGRRRWL